MRRILVSRSSLENPSPLLRFVRITSPSSISTLAPESLSRSAIILPMVVFPAPESPVNHNANPLCSMYHLLLIAPMMAGNRVVLCEYQLYDSNCC